MQIHHHKEKHFFFFFFGFLSGSDDKESALQCERPRFNSWVERSPGEGNVYTPVSWPGKSRGQRSLAGYSPWGCKEVDVTERLTLSAFKMTDAHLTHCGNHCPVCVNQVIMPHTLNTQGCVSMISQ